LWIKVHRVGAAALVALVGAQALIAGQHLFGSWGIGLHAGLGNAAFAVAVLTTAVAFMKLGDRPLQVVGVLMLVLLTSQIGLGYSARESQAAAALHVPLGVLTFAAMTYQLLAAWPALVIGSNRATNTATNRGTNTATDSVLSQGGDPTEIG